MTQRMTDDELWAIEARVEAFNVVAANPTLSTENEMAASQADVPALVAEVRRLPDLVREAYLLGWHERATHDKQDIGSPSFSGLMNRAQAAVDKFTTQT